MTETKLGFRCRRGWHLFRCVRTDGSLLHRDSRKRHTFTHIEECVRCGTERRTEIFNSHGYWEDFRRRLEDERLERVIRKAML